MRAGCKTSGVLFLDEFTKEETSTAVSHSLGQGLNILCRTLFSWTSGSSHSSSSALPRMTGILWWISLMNALAAVVRIENDERSCSDPGRHVSHTPARLIIGSCAR